jgi:hypothetical protein
LASIYPGFVHQTDNWIVSMGQTDGEHDFQLARHPVSKRWHVKWRTQPDWSATTFATLAEAQAHVAQTMRGRSA